LKTGGEKKEKEKEMENEHDNNIAKNGKTSSMSFTF
jgi:hypothetical protein